MELTSYKTRREKLLENKTETVAVLVAAKESDYFKQDSNFRYFTGFNEPQSYLVISNQNGIVTSHLFLRKKNEFEEMWNGKRLGVEKAKEILDIENVYPISEFQSKIADLLHGHHSLLLDFSNKDLMEEMRNVSLGLQARRKIKKFIPRTFEDINPLSGSLRLIKEDNEIHALKKASELTSLAHKAAMAMTTPAINESELDRLLSFYFKREGGSGSAYENIVAGGENALTLHYCHNNCELKDGELLLIDAGAQYNGYCADVTRTFPVGGTFTKAQKEIYQIVLESQKAAIALAKPGVTLKKIHEATVLYLTSALVELGILKGSIQDNIEKEAYRKYYPHGTGHWLGLDVHDNCPYLDHNLEEIPFSKGMVFTVEPGLYFPIGDTDVPVQYQGIGIRIEDDILVTENTHINLTASIPKEIKEVEEACAQNFKDFISERF